MPEFQMVSTSCTSILNTTECLAAAAAGDRLLGCFDCPPVSQQFFLDAETACIVVFTVEYLGRILCVSALSSRDQSGEQIPKNQQPGTLKKMWMFWKDTMNLIDFFAIVPYYLELIFKGSGEGLSILRILRLARIFRIFKLGKYSTGMKMYVKGAAKQCAS
jgi:hypothetical protein